MTAPAPPDSKTRAARIRQHPYLGLLISTFPEAFRERHGQDIAEAAALQRSDARYQRVGVGELLFWWDVSIDLVSSALRLQTERFVSPYPRPFPPEAQASVADPVTSLPLGGLNMLQDERETANDRLKRRASSHVWWGLIAATLAHASVLSFFPTFTTESVWAADAATEIDVIPPRLDLPKPPERIARPAAPRVVVDAVSEDVTFASLDEMWDVAPGLAPPPTTNAQSNPSGAVWLGPSMTAPRLKNAEAVERALRSEYPAVLRDAGIGGRAQLELLVDATGQVREARIRESAGYAAFDRAAIAVAEAMVFVPALNLDKPLAVWVVIPVSFEIKDDQ